jgi:Pvc16 N-terminal domain
VRTGGPLASFAAIEAVGKSIERFLLAQFRAEEPISDVRRTTPLLIRTEDFAAPRPFKAPALTVFMYRVEVNRMLRPAWSAIGYLDGEAHLPLDLHFLFTAWGDNAEEEYRILGRTMQAFESQAILTGPALSEVGNWRPNEGINVLLDDLPTDSLMRTFDSLQADYKLSVPYLARVIRIDSRTQMVDKPVANALTGATPSSTPDD